MTESVAAPAKAASPAPPPSMKYELVSYLTLRRVAGVLGVSMPIVVAVWGFVLVFATHDLALSAAARASGFEVIG